MLKFYLASTSVFKTFEVILIPFKRGFGSTLKGMKVGLEGIPEDEETVIGLLKVGYQLQMLTLLYFHHYLCFKKFY